MQIKKFTNNNLYNELAKELMILAELDGAQSTCLDILKDLSFDIQVKILKNLGKSSNPGLIPFFQFVSNETEGELKNISEKAIKKYQYLGYKITPSEFQKEKIKIIQAFASPTRLEGNCLLIFLTQVDNQYQAHHFAISFNHKGIKEYFQYKSVNKKEILNRIKEQKLIEISVDQGKMLLQDAFRQNKKFQTKCATGFNQYKLFLDDAHCHSSQDYQLLMLNLGTKGLSPECLINAYLIALKNMDAGLIYDLSHSSLKEIFGERSEFITKWVNPFEKYTFVKTVPSKWQEKRGTIFNETQIVVTTENEELRKITLEFVLLREKAQWFITEVKISQIEQIGERDPLNPLNNQIHVDIYSINSLEKVVGKMDEWDDIHLTGEFDNGVCYKWFKKRNLVKEGINVFDDVFGEFILTDHELVIFSSKGRNLSQIAYQVNKRIGSVKGVKIQLEKRTICPMGEIYKGLTKAQQLFRKLITKDSEIVCIPEKDHEEWYQFFVNNHTDTIILADKAKVFYSECQGVKVEGLFYGKTLLVFLLNTSLKEARGKIKNFPPNPPCNISKIENNFEGNNNWNNLKLICKVKNDQFLQLYLPTINKQLLAKRMGILV